MARPTAGVSTPFAVARSLYTKLLVGLMVAQSVFAGGPVYMCVADDGHVTVERAHAAGACDADFDRHHPTAPAAASPARGDLGHGHPGPGDLGPKRSAYAAPHSHDYLAQSPSHHACQDSAVIEEFRAERREAATTTPASTPAFAAALVPWRGDRRSPLADRRPPGASRLRRSIVLQI